MSRFRFDSRITVIYYSLSQRRIIKYISIYSTGCLKKNATSEFPKKSTLQFLSIKDFRPLGIEIELLLIDHITVVVNN